MARSCNTVPNFNLPQCSGALGPGQSTTSSTYKEAEPKHWKLATSVLSVKIVNEPRNDTMGFKITLGAREIICFPILFISKCV